jgi:Mg2+ and Co2+ transporter CorA
MADNNWKGPVVVGGAARGQIVREVRENDPQQEVNADQLEQEIIDMYGGLKPQPLPPLPSYVKHSPAIDEVGRVSSEVLIQSFEASAKALEAKAKSLLEAMAECDKETLALVRFLETTRTETQEAIQRCEDAAQAYRDEAKRMFGIIQRRSMLAAQVRETCTNMIADIQKAD